MTLYEYRPPSSTRAEKLAVALILLLSCAMAVIGAILDIRLLGAAAAATVLAGVLVCARAVLTAYVYAVELRDDGGADLVIYEIRGGRGRAVCRVSAGDGRLTDASKGRRPEGRFFNCCPGFRRPGRCYFLPSEAEGGGVISFIPDDTMKKLLKDRGAG
jgi:hypothetical protein